MFKISFTLVDYCYMLVSTFRWRVCGSHVVCLLGIVGSVVLIISQETLK